jgi:hypothetical protein
MVGFKSIVTVLAFVALFSGVIGSISYDILLLIGKPSIQSLQYVVKDLASIVTNSQGEISSAIKEFKTAEGSYASFLIARIIGGTIITLFLIWLFYKGLTLFIPIVTNTDRIAVFLLSLFMVWVLGVLSSYLVGKPNWIPYSGFIDLIINKDILINYIIKNIM